MLFEVALEGVEGVTSTKMISIPCSRISSVVLLEEETEEVAEEVVSNKE